jgi:glutathione synthase/RimK-type ligase-like ATP-grasp enzyme
MRVAVLRCQRLPKFVTWEVPNVEKLFTDDRLLIAGFAKRGVDAASVSWGDPGMDWNRFDLALLRSTWDYIDERERFLTVLSAIEASRCLLFNPLAAVRWNSDKHYLFDLADWGVPTVPTYRVSTTDHARLLDTAAKEGWPDVVLKPRVGAGGSEVHRVAPQEVAGTLAKLSEKHPQYEFLAQPLIESVITEGEWSFIFIDGGLSHVLLKKPAPGDYRAHGIYGGSVASAEPTPEDRRQAEAMLGKLPFDLLYARLDLVRVDGRLAVMELELVEPMLYFDRAPASIGRLVGATMARLRRA